MIYVCPEKDCRVSEPCNPCICGMNKLKVFGGTEDAKPRVDPPPAGVTCIKCAALLSHIATLEGEQERMRAALDTDRVTEAELKRVGRIEGIGGLLTTMQKNGWEIRRQQKSGH